MSAYGRGAADERARSEDRLLTWRLVAHLGWALAGALAVVLLLVRLFSA